MRQHHERDDIGGLAPDQLVHGQGQVIIGQVVASSLPVAVLTVPGIIVVATQLVPPANMPGIILENVSSETLLVNDGASTQSVEPDARLVLAGMADGSARTLQVVIQDRSQAITLMLSSLAAQSGHSVLGQALVGSP